MQSARYDSEQETILLDSPLEPPYHRWSSPYQCKILRVALVAGQDPRGGAGVDKGSFVLLEIRQAHHWFLVTQGDHRQPLLP